MGPARNTKASTMPAIVPYNAVRAGVDSTSHSTPRLMSTPGVAHGAQTRTSVARAASERCRTTT